MSDINRSIALRAQLGWEPPKTEIKNLSTSFYQPQIIYQPRIERG